MTRNDGPNVFIFPPLLAAIAIGLGVTFHALHNVDLAPHGPLRLAGALLLALGFGLLFSAFATMERAGTNVDPSLPALKIVSQGPYRFTRNPMYLGICLLTAAAGLLICDWVALLCTIPLFLTLHYGVVLREERYLAFKFGETYLRYKADLDLYWLGDLQAAQATLDQIPPSLGQTDALVWTIYTIYFWRGEPDKLLAYLKGLPREWIHGTDYDGPTALLVGNAQWRAGRKEAAFVEWRMALKVIDEHYVELGSQAIQADWKGVVLGRLGAYAEAEKALQLAADLQGQECFDWGDRYQLKTEEGQLDAAMDIVDRIWPKMSAAQMRMDPDFGPIRDTPRFRAALAKAEADPQRSPYALGVLPGPPWKSSAR